MDSQRDSHASTSGRRTFLSRLAAASGASALVGCSRSSTPSSGPSAAPSDRPSATGNADADSSARPLRALFSNAGLQSTWCELGKKTALLWGKLLNVEVDWLDGEFDPEKQRNKIDAAVQREFDFACFQAVQIDSLAAPVRKLKKRGIPVISMDTLLVAPNEMRDVGVWVEVAPDQVFMGESSARFLMEKIGGKGKVIHIGGLSAHSGARGRQQGFDNVKNNYPNVEVVGGGVRWCDWKKQKARETFETLLAQNKEPIAGAFFHSDDMALACLPALPGSIHKDMVITAVDGQREGLEAVRAGTLAATTVNPVCLIHKTALVVGQFIIRNKEPIESLPLEIITPGPLVSKDTRNLDAMLYLADPLHCMV